MFWARARLRARDRRPYLAVTEDVATADDHGALPTIMRAGIGDVPSLWKHHTGRDKHDTEPFMSIFMLIEYDAGLCRNDLYCEPSSFTAANVCHCNAALDLKLNLRL